MPRHNDSDSMDDLNDTQSTQNGTPGGGDDPPPNEQLTEIYARQLEEAQQILEEGATGPEAVSRVGKLLKESSLLCKQEKKVRESVFGSHVLSVCAQISRNQALQLDTNLSSFDVEAFADGILNYALDSETDQHKWGLIANRTLRLFHRTPAVSYLYGSFKATELPRKEPKERVARQRANRAAAEKKEPEKVTNVAATDEGNDKAVQHLRRVLKKHFKRNGNQPISFFECVLDPTSFHRTVENIFHLSFLMKNNLYAIRQENGGLPYIHVVPPVEVNNLQKGKKLQCIVSISPEQWQTLVQVFKVKQPMVPPMV